MKTPATLAIIALAASTLAAHAKSVTLAEVPPAVQETIKANVRGATIEEIDVLTVDGRTLYVSEVDLPGDRDLDVHVSAEGQLIKTKEDIVITEAPAAVQDAVKKLEAEGGKLDDIDKEVAAGKATYHVDINRDKVADLDVVLAEDGSVISRQEEQ